LKTLAAELAYFLRGRARQNLKLLLGYTAFLAGLIILYAWMFDYLMLTLEGRRYSFASGIYWTITAMTTLGFGDITFESDAGRLFSSLVTVSGVIFLLVMLPFGMITLFLAPWLEERLRYRPPDRVGQRVQDHVIIAGWDPLSRAIVNTLRARHTPYTVLEREYDQAVRLDESGVSVVYGLPTDAETLRLAHLDRARAVFANLGDTGNVNLILTVRSLSDIPIYSIANVPERRRFMELAGATDIIALKDLLGGQLAVRSTTMGAYAHVIDQKGDLLFAELPAGPLGLSGLSLQESGLRERDGLNLVGIWEKGELQPALPEATLRERTVLVAAATEEQLMGVEERSGGSSDEDLVLILGWGSVGRSAGAFLEEHGVPYRIVELQLRDDERPPNLILGDASEPSVLARAGIEEARGVIVTTNDDGTNVFLTLVCRDLNPGLRIVARANREENVSELYAAGADFVVSLVSLGATLLLNALGGKETTFLTEGVHIFWGRVPRDMVGRRLAASGLRRRTGATLVAVRRPEEDGLIQAEPDLILEKDLELLLVGRPEAEETFSGLRPADG
jgi:voltage-gated potassium channel